MRDIILVTAVFVGLIVFAAQEIKNVPVRESEQIDLTWDDTPESLKSKCEEHIGLMEALIDEIVYTPAEKRTFESVVLKVERKGADIMEVLDPLTFYSSVSPDEALRDASTACQKNLSKTFIEAYARKDFFEAFETVKQNENLITNKLDAKLLEEYYDGFIRNGMKLPDAQRDRLIVLNKRLVELGTDFRKTLNTWQNPLKVSTAGLEGMPKEFINSLKKDGSKYLLTLKYPHFYPVMRNGSNADTRRELQYRFMTRGGEENRARLQEAIKIRAEKAKLLGYASHAHYRLAKKMAKDPSNVSEFLNKLKTGLTPKAKQEYAVLVDLKKEETGDANITQLEPWDWRYYANQLVKKNYEIDAQKVKEYFPLDVVTKGMFDIYETLLGVSFHEIPNSPVWHESVKKFAVYDAGLETNVAYFYMDLFPREGKYGHAAAFTLTKGRELPNGKYRRPTSSIVANFNAPNAEQPSLLTHNQVETLFHEFGHIMHQILTQAKYTYFSGTSVKRDFVEAPSQMLENWVWRKNTLRKLSAHYQTGEALPDELLNKMIKAKNATSGITYLRQLFFATLDLTYHTHPDPENIDTTEIYHRLMKDIMLVGPAKNSYPEASFGHLMGGYDAGYYGYLWSEVFAQDMFTKFDQKGLLNSSVGRDYKRWILEPGGTEDPDALIGKFLGREPNQDAFLKDLGIN